MRRGLLSGSSIVPAAITLGVLVTMVVLVAQVTLRPWAGTDNGFDTHLNYSSVSADYGRAGVARVGAPEIQDGWKPAAGADLTDGLTNWVGAGCASCHSLDGSGGIVGPNTDEVTFDELVEHVREGDEGMPAYPASVLDDERLATIAVFLGIDKPLTVVGRPAGRPVPTPVPATATAPATATETPSPSQPTGPGSSGTPGADASQTPAPTTGGEPTNGPGPEPSPTKAPEVPTPAVPAEPELPVTLTAATASISVDGLDDDWAGIEPADVIYKSIAPIRGKKVPALPPITGQLSVAIDDQNVYVMLKVDDDVDFVPGDRKRSSKVAVMFLIEPDAEPHMGATEEDQRTSLGMVDIWHWTLDCGPGELAGGKGGGATSGNDPACNLDDEFALTPKDLEDDGSTQAENSLQGVWSHSGLSGGNGTAGSWTFELSRPLVTGDPQDVQLAAGTTVKMALAYWDADQSERGWTDLGHLQTSWMGWIEVTLP